MEVIYAMRFIVSEVCLNHVYCVVVSIVIAHSAQNNIGDTKAIMDIREIVLYLINTNNVLNVHKL